METATRNAEREIEILKKIDHPCLIKTEDFYQTDESYYIVLEYVEAKDLVKKLLVVDPAKRLGISEALEHPWLKDEKMRETAHRLMYPGQPTETTGTSQPTQASTRAAERPVRTQPARASKRKAEEPAEEAEPKRRPGPDTAP
ncbi:hypothetical protein SRHO_G00266760 [Serrasalmus rhombeus]